jgi:hypothetical protein
MVNLQDHLAKVEEENKQLKKDLDLAKRMSRHESERAHKAETKLNELDKVCKDFINKLMILENSK